jgi:hypothetical protein
MEASNSALKVLDWRLRLIVGHNISVNTVISHALPSSQNIVTPMKEALCYSETSVLTRAAWRNIQQDAIFRSHSRENLKPYIVSLVLWGKQTQRMMGNTLLCWGRHFKLAEWSKSHQKRWCLMPVLQDISLQCSDQGGWNAAGNVARQADGSNVLFTFHLTHIPFPPYNDYRDWGLIKIG